MFTVIASSHQYQSCKRYTSSLHKRVVVKQGFGTFNELANSGLAHNIGNIL
jgi:hypothetical protein